MQISCKVFLTFYIVTMTDRPSNIQTDWNTKGTEIDIPYHMYAVYTISYSCILKVKF